jgi:hypothetical protein
MNRRTEETKIVKYGLIKAGYKATVKHGRGTAHSWIDVDVQMVKPQPCTCETTPWGTVERCDSCKNAYQNHYRSILELVRQLTGRHGEYENIGVDINLI